MENAFPILGVRPARKRRKLQTVFEFLSNWITQRSKRMEDQRVRSRPDFWIIV